MANREDVLEAARAIRPYLDDLLGPRAASVDAQIAELLAPAARGEDVTYRLARLLREDTATREWVAAFLAVRRSAETEKGYTRLPGARVAVLALRMECPRGDYVRYLAAAGEPAGCCPSHDLPLHPG